MYHVLEGGLLGDEIGIIIKSFFRLYLQLALDKVLLSGQISLPDMKETKRNVSWHAGEDISMEQAESIIFDSDGMSPEMTLHSCLLLTFSHLKKKVKKKKKASEFSNSSPLDGRTANCLHALLQISAVLF